MAHSKENSYVHPGVKKINELLSSEVVSLKHVSSVLLLKVYTTLTTDRQRH